MRSSSQLLKQPAKGHQQKVVAQPLVIDASPHGAIAAEPRDDLLKDGFQHQLYARYKADLWRHRALERMPSASNADIPAKLDTLPRASNGGIPFKLEAMPHASIPAIHAKLEGSPRAMGSVMLIKWEIDGSLTIGPKAESKSLQEQIASAEPLKQEAANTDLECELDEYSQAAIAAMNWCGGLPRRRVSGADLRFLHKN